jgi:hypothetical protein
VSAADGRRIACEIVPPILDQSGFAASYLEVVDPDGTVVATAATS